MEGRSPGTWRAYRSAFRRFVKFCDENGYEVIPASPDVIAAYVTERARDLAIPSIEVAVAAVAAAHEVSMLETPTRHPLVKATLAGLRRRQRSRQPRKVQPIKLEMLARMLENMPGNELAVVRNKSVATLTWWAALRRSETVALDWEDLRFAAEGVEVTVRHAKGDQLGVGATVALPRTDDPLCPATALTSWRDLSGLRSGPLYVQVDRNAKLRARRLTPQTVALIFKAAAEAAGYYAGVISGHSARRGFISAAARGNVPEHVIAKHSRHASVETLRGYIEHDRVLDDGAAIVLARAIQSSRDGED